MKNIYEYIQKEARYYGRIYGIDEEDLANESWLRMKKNKMNKKYIQMRVRSVAIDMIRKEIKQQKIIMKLEKNIEDKQWEE